MTIEHPCVTEANPRKPISHCSQSSTLSPPLTASPGHPGSLKGQTQRALISYGSGDQSVESAVRLAHFPKVRDWFRHRTPGEWILNEVDDSNKYQVEKKLVVIAALKA